MFSKLQLVRFNWAFAAPTALAPKQKTTSLQQTDLSWGSQALKDDLQNLCQGQQKLKLPFVMPHAPNEVFPEKPPILSSLIDVR